MTRRVSRFGVVPMMFAFGLLVGAATTAVALAVYQPHMHAANRALHTALNELQAATPDKHGHRDNAINLVEQAIRQVDWGIHAGNR